MENLAFVTKTEILGNVTTCVSEGKACKQAGDLSSKSIVDGAAPSDGTTACANNYSKSNHRTNTQSPNFDLNSPRISKDATASTKGAQVCAHPDTLQGATASIDLSQLTNSLSKVTLSPSSSLSNGLSAHAQETEFDDIEYVSYKSELQMPDIMRLIQKDLSEPYSIYTYRYFIHNWPKLCFLAMYKRECVGAIVCKLDIHRKAVRRGYIAMLAVDQNHRKRKIGSNLVLKAICAMVADDADEVVLETEITNKPALRLYENLGFVRDKRLFRYYLNGVDALRLKLWLR